MKINYFLNTKVLSNHYKSRNTSFDKEIINNNTITSQRKACNILAFYLSCDIDNLTEMDIENVRISLWLLDEGVTPNIRTKNVLPLIKKIKDNKYQLKEVLISKLNEYSIPHEVV